MLSERRLKTDVLVIGSGIAGLNFALSAREWGDVTIVTKKKMMESNTNYAQGGIAAVISPKDSYEDHIHDTLVAGCGLSDPKAVKILVDEGPRTIQHLISHGVVFDMLGENLSLGLEGGHCHPRIVHAGDYTGQEIERKLVYAAKTNSIRLFEYCLAYELMIHKGVCRGARVLNIPQREVVSIAANVTVLATGGVGQLYQYTSNPRIATGDGIAMAARAGAELMDLEFVQFHPTTLNIPRARNFLISEAVRGEGGVLRNVKGEEFMQKYDPRRDLAPRDTVSRAVWQELRDGPVFLDITSKPENMLRARFPRIYSTCLKYGINIATDQIPVVPAAHYLCGGIRTDYEGESSIPRLFALGECACTGVHGANRLASNSLLESVVFSTRAVRKAKKYRSIKPWYAPYKTTKFLNRWVTGYRIRRTIQKLMWTKAGIIRSIPELKSLLLRLQELKQIIHHQSTQAISPAIIELQSLITVGVLVAQAALYRRESRGTHYLREYPEQDDLHWKKHIVFVGQVLKDGETSSR
ncbi:MAG: L-aspartate oxidase [Candidatus Ranarchaeia archaeon]